MTTTAALPQAGLGPAASASTVLVVEDDAALRRVAVRSLERAGYRVLAAADGAEALGLLAAEAEVALMISDLLMAGMDGNHLAAEAGRRHPGVKVLLMSGFSRDAVAAGNAQRAFLQKPFTPSELVACVARLLQPVAG